MKYLVLAATLAMTPLSASAMALTDANALAVQTAKTVKSCTGGACVSSALGAAKSKMKGMPVLSKTSTALSKVTKMIAKTCAGGCSAESIAAIQKEAAKRGAILGKSRHKQDKAFAVVFDPANFTKKQLAK